MKTQQPLRVLIAEDDPVTAEMIGHVLVDLGHHVVAQARNGVEAVQKTAAEKPDVVLMDIMMPVKDGLEATREIQACCPCPVILLTGHNDPDLVTRASESGAAAYVVKPPDALELERTMAIAVARFEDLMTVRRLNAELESALREIKTLRGIIPICCHCKKIRDDQGFWEQVEAYLTRHSDAKFSHGICPTCIAAHYPDLTEGQPRPPQPTKE